MTKLYETKVMETVMKELVEYIGRTYPQLPYTLIIQTSDGQQFSRAQSEILTNPVYCTKLLAENINHIANLVISQQVQVEQAMRQVQLLQSITVNENQLKN